MNEPTTFPRLLAGSALNGAVVRTFVTCLLIVSLSSADQSLFGYAIPSITREFGVGLPVIGNILSLAFLVACPTVVVAGLLSDRWGRRPVMLGLLTLSATCVGLQAFAHSIAILTLLRVVGFASGGCMYALTGAAMIEQSPDRFRGLLVGALQIGYPLGFALGSVAVTTLLQPYGWRALFLPALAIPFLVPVLYFQLGPGAVRVTSADLAPPVPWHQRLAALVSARHLRTSLAGFAGSFFSNFAIGSLSYFLPTYLVQSRGLSAAAAGAIVGSSYALGAAGYLVAATTGEFLTTRRNTLVLWITLGTALFGVALALPDGTRLLIPAFSVVIFFLFGSEGVRVPLLGELYPTYIRATAMAAVGSLSVAAALLIAPIMVTHGVGYLGWTKALYAFGGFPLVLAAISYAFLPNPRSGRALDTIADNVGERLV